MLAVVIVGAIVALVLIVVVAVKPHRVKLTALGLTLEAEGNRRPPGRATEIRPAQPYR